MLQILLLLAFVIIAAFFLVTQQKTLQSVQPANRLMNPGLVWLQLIPIFGELWQFFVVVRIADSIRKEIASRQDDSILGFSDADAVEQQGKHPTLAIGIAYCTFITIGIILNTLKTYTSSFLIVPALFSLAGVTCWIIYWIQLGKFKRRLSRMQLSVTA